MLQRQSLLREQERAENFPVALRILPAQLRTDLRAVYDVVRVIDELGDSAPGDRTTQLVDFARDLATVWDGGTPQASVLRRLTPTVLCRGLTQQPFQELVEANLQDQRVASYQTFEELMQYCVLSAAPIGRIVLQILGAATPEQLVLSDRVCCALQLVEHWQDVAEDRRAGRVYLPQDDLHHFGLRTADLDADHAKPALRQLIVFETDRAEALLDSGAALVRQLPGWGRLAVAGYVAGGRAATDSLRRVHGDVLGNTPRVRRRDVGKHLVAELRRAS
jgi:squalene synthase HpnC